MWYNIVAVQRRPLGTETYHRAVENIMSWMCLHACVSYPPDFFFFLSSWLIHLKEVNELSNMFCPEQVKHASFHAE